MQLIYHCINLWWNWYQMNKQTSKQLVNLIGTSPLFIFNLTIQDPVRFPFVKLLRNILGENITHRSKTRTEDWEWKGKKTRTCRFSLIVTAAEWKLGLDSARLPPGWIAVYLGRCCWGKQISIQSTCNLSMPPMGPKLMIPVKTRASQLNWSVLGLVGHLWSKRMTKRASKNFILHKLQWPVIF